MPPPPQQTWTQGQAQRLPPPRAWMQQGQALPQQQQMPLLQPPPPPPRGMQLPQQWEQHPWGQPQTMPPMPSMTMQPPPAAWTPLPPQPPPQAHPQWGNPPPQETRGHGDLRAFAGAGFTGFGPPLDPDLSSRVLVCDANAPTREVAELDKSDQILCTRDASHGWVEVSNPVRVREVVRSGEARDNMEGRAVSCEYLEAHIQHIERGGQTEGSPLEQAFEKGLIPHHDWHDERRAPERTLEAINYIATKVVDGRTVALGCTCPMDGGACHRNVIRRAVLRAAMRKMQELDSRRRDRDQRSRSRSRSPPQFGGRRSFAPPRFGGRPSYG